MREKPNVVVITGASAGVGRATVREFARRGARIGLIARGEERLDQTKREVEAMGGRALVLPADVADHDQIENAAEQVEKEFGPIDIWINNAMATVFARFLELTPEEYKRVTDVTYLGQVHGARAALRRMVPRDRGTIVLVGSALAYRGIPLQSAYCGAKHAIQGFQDSVRMELLARGSNVRLNMVQLPAVNTPQFDWALSKLATKPKPVGGIYQPEVVARAIHFAAHNDRKQIKVGLTTVGVVLANKIASPLLDWFFAKRWIKGQQSSLPASPDRRGNLWRPAIGDFAAHGRFDDRAKTFSPQLWCTMNREKLALSALAVLVLAATLLYRGETEPDAER